MAQITPFGTNLTEYTIQLLHRHKINKVKEFLDTDISELTKITNLPESTVADLKRDLRKLHGLQRLKLSHIHKKILKYDNFNTGIERLDLLLGETSLRAGTVWEICGFSGVGKTQFCHTLVLNITNNYDCDALYIDTKYDFSGRRIRQMLQSRNIAKMDAGHIMQHIKVEHTKTLRSLINLLQDLSTQLDLENTECEAIKFIVIDALPAIWYQYCDDDSRRRGMLLLTKLSNIICKLAVQHLRTFLIVNITVHAVEQAVDSGLKCSQEKEDFTDFEQNDDMVTAHCGKTLIRPALGRYWLSMPHIRLCLKSDLTTSTSASNTNRKIEVLKSCYTASNVSCDVRLTVAGVI